MRRGQGLLCYLMMLLLAGGNSRSLRPTACTLLSTPGLACRASLCIAEPHPVAHPATQPPAPADPDDMLVGGLAFLAGVTDVMTFDHYGCFANMMTGNTFRAMGALASAQWAEGAFNAALVLSYVTGVAAYRRAELWQTVRRRPAHHIARALLAGRPSGSSSLASAPSLLSLLFLL